MPKSPQDSINRIATFLSDTSNAVDNVQSTDSIAMYGLGTRYGGVTGSRFTRERQLLSKSIKGTHGCYLCGEKHRGRTCHIPK